VRENIFVFFVRWRLFFMVIAIGVPLWIYFPSMGGSGLNLPFNALIYCSAAVMVFFIWLPTRERINITEPLIYFIIGGLVLNIPLLYADAGMKVVALWRAVALLAGAVFYFSWLQLSLRFQQRRRILYAVLLLIGVQALIALLQIFAPALSWAPVRGGRVYGSFLQPNVLGSFIATGVALLLMLFLVPGYVWHRYEPYRTALLAVGVVILSALLVWVQSRAAWLGAGATLILFLCLFGHRMPRRCLTLGALVLAGVLLGIGVMLWTPGDGTALSYINHQGSTLARLSMLYDTLAMIADKPLLGWGYGGFEYHFQHFRIAQVPPTTVTEIARHPHNEILLWWAEGGVVALAGIAIILAGGGRLLVQVIRHDREAFALGKRTAGEGTAICLVLLPMLIHTQLEYPFYLSAVHWLAFLLLLATADRLSGGVRWCWTPPVPIGVVFSNTVRLLALSCAVMMLAAFQGGLLLTYAERSGMKTMEAVDTMSPLMTLAHRERREFDHQTRSLLSFNRTQNVALLEGYVFWAKDYLERRIDKNVYSNLIVILRSRGDIKLAEHYRQQGELFFPDDVRFSVRNK
jgi:O-antigen polymerase